MNNNIFNNHPIIKNSNQYFYEKKYISIHSEDRDVTKYPKSAEFEVILPQEYLNVASARLHSWSFPANYSVFSINTYNVIMTYKFIKLYNPGEHSFSDPLTEGIFAALYSHKDMEIIVNIEPGFYNPDQMATELTNKLNENATRIINDFFNIPANAITYATAKSLFVSYNRFNVAYNSVSQKIWFGNNADQFVLSNSSNIYVKKYTVDSNCIRKNMLPEWSNWGLPYYLGFTRCDAYSFNVQEFLEKVPAEGPVVTSLINNVDVPRFFYGDAVEGSGDNGYWLIPVLPGAQVYFLEAPFKISFMGQAYIYMEVDGMNCIDETSPWNLSNYTSQTNQTNSIVNSSFAKIAVPTTPISQWFDNDMGPYKYWNPPAERISKLKFKFRYHNGMLVEFGQFEYSFMIEFNLLKPQQERSYSIVNAFDLGQAQSFASKYI
jgi:hypothetical protein